MIIDIHTHPWMTEKQPFHPRQVTLMESMDDYHIDKSVLLSMSIQENEEIAELVRDHPTRYIPFYWVELNLGIMPALRRLEEDVQTHHFKGLKLYPYFSHIQASDKRMYPVYAKAVELGLVCLWHMGDVAMIEDREQRYGDQQFSPTPLEIASIAADFPELKIVMAHLGGNFYYQALVAAERHANIMLDTAWLHYYIDRMPYSNRASTRVETGIAIDLPRASHDYYRPFYSNLIEKAVAVLGSERIVYGGEGTLPDDIRNCNLSEEQKIDILGCNTARLLNL
jgi:predicted TIM-barrel fold metal-dependent hydrolase